MPHAGPPWLVDAMTRGIETARGEHRFDHLLAGLEIGFLPVTEQRRHAPRISDPGGAEEAQATLVTRPERRQRVQTRMRRGVPSTAPGPAAGSGRWTRLVLMFEWLTLIAGEPTLAANVTRVRHGC